MKLLVIFLILYLIIPPGIFVAFKFSKNHAKQALFGRRKSATQIRREAAKEGINKKIVKRLNFTIRDPRDKPVPFRTVFFSIYGAGALLAMYGGYQENWSFLWYAVFFAYVAMVFSVITAHKIVSERDTVLKRMLELKGSAMKFVNRDKDTVATPANEFRVKEWSEDLVHPEKIELFMPTDFDTLEVDGFLESFNRVFDSNGQWVSDTDAGGFDFNAGVAHIRVSPKLPQIAMWDERYLNPKHIHWSYFPLALGAENGVPIVNEETGETEYVLGFAVNSGQEKLSSKNEVQIGPEITAAPQVLVAGGTGGGKALATTSLVNVIVE